MSEEMDEVVVDEQENGTELPDDPATLKALVDKYRSEAEDYRKKVSEANGNAKNLRLKKKTIEQELDELRQYKQQQEDLRKQAELAELSEAEKLKRLLQEEQATKADALTKAKAAQREAQEAKFEAQLLQMDVSDKGLRLIKPMLLQRMQEDDFDMAETMSELRTEFPALFKAQPEKKQVIVPASSGAPAVKQREPKLSQERQRVASRSESLTDRQKHKKDTLPKYGITI